MVLLVVLGVILLTSSQRQVGDYEMDKNDVVYNDYRDGLSVEVSVPGIQVVYGGSNMSVVVNTAIASKTRRFLELAKSIGVVVVWSKGIYNRRYVRGSKRNWSSHAWRMGIDISGFTKEQFGVDLEKVRQIAIAAGFEQVLLDYEKGKMHYDHVHVGDRVDGSLVPPISM